MKLVRSFSSIYPLSSFVPGGGVENGRSRVCGAKLRNGDDISRLI